VSSFKLKRIFYESDVLPARNPIYSRYNGQTIDAIIIDDTKSKRRSGGRPSIKGVLGLNLESEEGSCPRLGSYESSTVQLLSKRGQLNQQPTTGSRGFAQSWHSRARSLAQPLGTEDFVRGCTRGGYS
jgi:hypothetical protein